MHGIQPYTNLGDPNDKAYKIYKASDTGEVFSPVSEVQDTEKIAKLPEQLKVAWTNGHPISEGLIVLIIVVNIRGFLKSWNI